MLGSGIGIPLGMVQMTAVPQRTALSHAFGALCVTLVGTAEFYLRTPNVPKFMMSVLSMEVILGGLTFTGSLMAAGKLQEILPQRPITYKGQNLVNFLLLAVAIGSAVYLVLHPEAKQFFPLIVGISLIFGVLLIIPIGGADMPTVISLLNSYAGLSAAAMGFVLDNKLLIIAGALDGSSGFILSVIMCKAMNRSFTNVLFGAFGQVQAAAAGAAGSSAGAQRHAPRRPRRFSPPPTTWSSSPATAWRWRRRSTRSASSTTSSPRRESTSNSPSIPSPAACPAT